MITRGHFIGEIVDYLSTIQTQVENRCSIGLTDLNRYLEDFFKEILNRTYGLNLENLNSERSNEPGLDLGDEANSTAFQITSQKTSQKINSTITKITAEHISKYQNIYILIIGKKQGQYTLDDELIKEKEINFSDNNILDINSIIRQIIPLPLDKLKYIYDYIYSEFVRVKIELEVPDQEGKYHTNIEQFVEAIPIPTFGSCENLYSFFKNENSTDEVTQSMLSNDLKEFSELLSNIPRITREFLSFLIERREKDRDADVLYANYDKIKRICHYPDIDGEIRILQDCGIISIQEIEYDNQIPLIAIYCPCKSGIFLSTLVYFIEEMKIGYRTPFVNLDFSKL